MNLLDEKHSKEYSVIKTEITKKLTIDNVTVAYPVYQIKLDKLFFNDQNDRVATWISKYKSDNKISEITIEKPTVYNDILHKFIIESNAGAIHKTQNNIEIIGQQEPGVILSDGRIIDGNRRFTCLRNIQNKTGETQYFEAVILDRTLENNKKQIKMLELWLQHGVEERVGYDPIERLVGIYNDIIDSKLLSIQEYANSTSMSTNEVILEIDKANLMIEFLEFINADKNFHLARQFNIIDPLKELNSIIKKTTDSNKKANIKNVVFTQLAMLETGDKTRHLRKLREIFDSQFSDSFLEEQMLVANKFLDKIEKTEVVTKEEISTFRADKELENDITLSNIKFKAKVDAVLVRTQPVKLISSAFESLNSIDLNIVKKLDVDKKDDIKNRINEINEVLERIKRSLDV